LELYLLLVGRRMKRKKKKKKKEKWLEAFSQGPSQTLLAGVPARIFPTVRCIKG
jgi:hypothetical protein